MDFSAQELWAAITAAGTIGASAAGAVASLRGIRPELDEVKKRLDAAEVHDARVAAALEEDRSRARQMAADLAEDRLRHRHTARVVERMAVRFDIEVTDPGQQIPDPDDRMRRPPR